LLEALDWRQRFSRDLLETPKVPRKGMRLTFDGMSTEILEQIIVGMDAIQRGVGRVCFVEVAQQVVHEMREGFENEHECSRGSAVCPDLPMVQ
jgi:hypothetical protein